MAGEMSERKRNSYKKGEIIEPYDWAKDGKAVVTGKRCWQCRLVSVVRYNNSLGGVSESCLNDCGPEALGKMLRF